MKIDKTVKKESTFVLLFSLVLCAAMMSVYLIAGCFSLSALIGCAISLCVGSLNFLLMGLTLQKALSDTDENAKKRMQASSSLRTLAMLVVVVVSLLVLGSELPVVLALLIPLIFPRVATTVRMLRMGSEAEKSKNGGGDAENE